MNTRPPDANFTVAGLWPTHEQMLVLKAALLPAQPAKAAFREWLGLIDLEADFNRDTFRLLPMMYENLRRHGVGHPLMGRLKGVYRLTWYKNNKLFHDLRPVMQALHDANIPTVLLKGVPLVQLYYRNVALRPMSDVDVLVPSVMAAHAIEVMTRFSYQRYAEATPDYLKYRHAMQYWSANEGEIDLHWHALCECCEQGADDFFWDTAQPFDFDGITSHAPDPTRMLVHTVVHGFRWNAEPPIRWIADATMILRRAGDEIDWDAVVTFAHERQLQYRLHPPLSFLKQHFAASIPDSVLARLEGRRRSLIQRIESTCVLRDLTELQKSPLGHLWIVFGDYCRIARNDRPIPFAIGFTHYLRFRWKLRGRSEIPAYIGRGVFKRIKRWLSAARAKPGELMN